MAAQVEDVHGAEVAGDGDERDGAGRFREEDRAANVHAVDDHPYVGVAVVDGAAVVVGGDEVLPAAQLVGIANGVDGGFTGYSGGTEAEQVHADAVELAEGLARGLVGAGHEAGSQAQHVAVEGEAVFERGLRAEGGERGRGPFERDGACVRYSLRRRLRRGLLRLHSRGGEHAAEREQSGPDELVHVR